MIRLRTFAVFAALFTGGVFLGLSMAEALAGPLTVRISGDSEPIDAMLIPPSSRGTRDHAVHRAVKVVQRDSSATEVRVEVQPEDLVPGMLFTVFSRSSNGLIVASPLKLVTEYDKAPLKVEAECGSTGLDGRLTELPNESLKRLVQIREKKIELLFERLRQQLDPAAVRRLSALEKDAGLSYPQEFSNELPRAEVVSRLLTLNALLQARAGQSIE